MGDQTGTLQTALQIWWCVTHGSTFEMVESSLYECQWAIARDEQGWPVVVDCLVKPFYLVER